MHAVDVLINEFKRKDGLMDLWISSNMVVLGVEGLRDECSST